MSFCAAATRISHNHLRHDELYAVRYVWTVRLWTIEIRHRRTTFYSAFLVRFVFNRFGQTVSTTCLSKTYRPTTTWLTAVIPQSCQDRDNVIKNNKYIRIWTLRLFGVGRCTRTAPPAEGSLSAAWNRKTILTAGRNIGRPYEMVRRVGARTKEWKNLSGGHYTHGTVRTTTRIRRPRPSSYKRTCTGVRCAPAVHLHYQTYAS